MLRHLAALSAMIALATAAEAALPWQAGAPASPAAKAAPAAPAAPADPAAALDQAVAALRKINPETMTEEQRVAKGLEVGAAWKTLIPAGKAGADRLKREIAALDASKEKDDMFRLGAAAVLWEIGGLAEADTVLGQWNAAGSPYANYHYVFFTALEAAATQDPRALPLLTGILRFKGRITLPKHALTLDWTGVDEFLWGAYGPRGLPELHKILTTAKDPVETEAAILLLAQAQYLPALPRLRDLAARGQGDVRRRAIWNLGAFGHPLDFEFLVKGLAQQDPGQAIDYVFALYEYGDLRAVPKLVPLLATPNDRLRNEVVACLERLLSPEAMEALRKHAKPAADASEPRKASGAKAAAAVDAALKAMGLTWEAYAAKPVTEKRTLLAGVRNRAEAEVALKKDDKPLSHDELVLAAAEWKRIRRITGGTYEWIETRHALAASTPDDIPLWLEVKSRLYVRLSGECIDEARIIDEIVRRLGRSRFRKEVGVTEKVEAPAPGGATANAK